MSRTLREQVAKMIYTQLMEAEAKASGVVGQKFAGRVSGSQYEITKDDDDWKKMKFKVVKYPGNKNIGKEYSLSVAGSESHELVKNVLAWKKQNPAGQADPKQGETQTSKKDDATASDTQATDAKPEEKVFGVFYRRNGKIVNVSGTGKMSSSEPLPLTDSRAKWLLDKKNPIHDGKTNRKSTDVIDAIEIDFSERTKLSNWKEFTKKIRYIKLYLGRRGMFGGSDDWEGSYDRSNPELNKLLIHFIKTSKTVKFANVAPGTEKIDV